MYPVIFIDAVHVTIRDGQIANRPIFVALAVTSEGHRDILGLSLGDGGEGAKYWLHVLTELKNRRPGGVSHTTAIRPRRPPSHRPDIVLAVLALAAVPAFAPATAL